MTQRKRKSQDESKHEAILAAAKRLFLNQGFSSTSMEAIAADARVTKQTVYAHYQSKDALFTHMVGSLCEQHSPPGALLQSKGKSIEVLLQEIGIIFLNMLTSKEVLAATRLVIAEAHNHPELAEHYYKNGTQRMLTLLAQFLAQRKKDGTLDIASIPAASSHFFSLLKGQYYVRMLLGIKPVPAAREKEKHVREVVDIFMKLYANPKLKKKTS